MLFSSGMECDECGRKVELSTVFVCPSCSRPISVTYNYEAISLVLTQKALSERERALGVWRYRELLPVHDPSLRISLAEGGTPLIRCPELGRKLRMRNLYTKLEGLNPTGSFKDRGSAAGVSFALERKMKAVGCVSTGNMAASTAAYAARARVRCFIFVPTFVTAEKVTQTLAYGARLISVKDLAYDQMYDQSHMIGSKEGIYMINSNSPLRVEGQKTFSYELCEDLNWAVPDWVVIPTSSGGNIYAVWKGFKEFKQLGFIDKLPKLLLAQTEGCAPIATAFKRERDKVEPFPNPHTIATALLNPKPPGGDRALRAVRESRGTASTASDQQILEASRELASSEGIFCEPAAATGYAVLKNLVKEGVIQPDETVVLDVTGVGFKDMKAAEKIAGKIETADKLEGFRL